SDPRTPSRGRRVALETAAVTPDGSHVFRAQGRLRDGPVNETAIGTVVARPGGVSGRVFRDRVGVALLGKIIVRRDAVEKSREAQRPTDSPTPGERTRREKASKRVTPGDR